MASPQFSKGDISLVAVLSLGTVAGLLYGYWFLVVFFGGILLVWFAFWWLFKRYNPLQIIALNQQKPKTNEPHYLRKYPEADVFKMRAVFFNAALVITLATILAALNWQKKTTSTAVFLEKPRPIPIALAVENINIKALPPPNTTTNTLEAPKPKPSKVNIAKLEIAEQKELKKEKPAIQPIKDKQDPNPDIPDILPDEPIAENPNSSGKDTQTSTSSNTPNPDPASKYPPAVAIDQLPCFVGCENLTDANERQNCSAAKLEAFIKEGLIYPSLAKKNKVTGTVMTTFLVMPDGKVDSVSIETPIKNMQGAGCNEEALRVIKSLPKWVPGKKGNKNWPVMYRVPVVFK